MIDRYILALILIFSAFTTILPPVGDAQTSTTQVSSDLEKGLQKIEEKVEKRRNELGIPDYREVDGIKLPFKSVNTTAGMGDIVSLVKSVKHNVAIDDKTFSPRRLVLK